MAMVFLSLGSNIGNPKANLVDALSRIEKRCGSIVCKSGIYESDSWGYCSPNKFHNMVISLDTNIEPADLLIELKMIENLMGRQESKEGYNDRIIDIDIIFYDDVVIQSAGLTIPHPLMEKRMFVLEPLNEIAPDFSHPVLNKKVKELLNSLLAAG